ncbi:MAG: DUF456 domain-containing protein [Flavobacteriaceae bacterium]|jgi:uncharacterized protein YqgC (DUF456 family)|nr:DUF456 domain-containing protein [Flavobacteriaceae bacterium]
MEDLIFKLLFAVLMLIGAAGAVLPVLPGAPLAFASLLLAKILNFSELSWWLIALFGVLTLVGGLLDYLLPIATTKKLGGSKYGIWGLVIGLIVGILFSPFGLISIILAPFLGALIGELIYDRKNHKRAMKAASGSVIGYFLTSGYGFLLSMSMLAVFLFYDIIRG